MPIVEVVPYTKGELMPLSRSFPDVKIPGISPGVNYCILRVDRTFDGMFESSQSGRPYQCGTGHPKKTIRCPTELTWRVTTPLACDECASIWPSTQLQAKGINIARADGFADFVGKFDIVKKAMGQPDVLYFSGTIELISRSGSHQILGEACDEKQHMEGWLVGRGFGPASKFSLRAVIVARAEFSIGVGPFADTSVNRITGALVKRP